jgi:hypothetical protein
VIGAAFVPIGAGIPAAMWGRPRIYREIRSPIRRMNKETPLLDAPRIHSELLMLDIEIAESTMPQVHD